MEKKKRLYYALGGFMLGLLTASLIWLHIRPRTNTDIPAGSGGNHADNNTGNPGGLPQSTTNPNQDTAHNNSTANIPSKTPDNSQIDNPTNTPDINPDTTINPGQNVNPDSNQTDNPTNTPDTNPDTTKNPGEDFNPDESEKEPPKDSPGTVTEITSAPPEDTAQNETPVNPPTNSPDKNPETTDIPEYTDPDSDRADSPSDIPTRMPEITPAPTKDIAPPENQTENTEAPDTGKTPDKDTEPPATDTPQAPASSAKAWDKTAVYTGGDIVSYEGCQYRAKWWTQGEKPDSSDVWEDLGIVDGEPATPAGTENAPIDASLPKDTELTDFKVVGYYPSWKPGKLQSVDFSIITHICYAFAIPTADGSLRDLENPETARALIKSAHANKAKVLLSIGGWSYNDTPLENVFMEATSSEEKIERFADNIAAMCREYGFDGIDMDWEHPRVDGTSAKQYETLMLTLSKKLRAKDKLLTAAVLSGATADGNIYYDAAAHTNAVLNAVDFINIMAYDGGDGERHSPYQFAVNCAIYWKETRGLPAHKVVLGVPFYARPSWADYGTILESVPDAHSKDHCTYNGMEAYYNGVDTIADKTAYAMENLGGIMIWELTQDTANTEKSLLQTIGKTISSASDKE